MPITYRLDKCFDIGTVYRAEEDKAYVIRKIGTNSTTKAVVKAGGAPCCELLAESAPKYPINTNLIPPWDLGSEYIVVPPDKTLTIDGESGKDIRAIGSILVLKPGEILPAGLLTRYDQQFKKFKSYQRGTYSHGTDAAWGDGVENNVLTFTCPAGERWRFDDFLGATVANVSGGLLQGQFGIRIYVDDMPYDLIETKMGRKGIDCISCHLPPKEDVNFEPFMLTDFPIELAPGRTLKISCINVSGGSISPVTGASLDVTVNIRGIREQV